jgi:hypothetical protein
MAGYLDQYGAGEEQRARKIKIAILSILAVAVTGGILFYIFKNYRQEQQVKHFFDLLSRKEYNAAYALWGCTDEKPCRDYPLEEFLKDWGPASGKADYHIARSRSCGSGVILTVGYSDREQDLLWVERDELTIGFSPWPGCPPGR